MAKLETKIEVSIERAIHQAMREVIQDIWDKHRVKIMSITADWESVGVHEGGVFFNKEGISRLRMDTETWSDQ